MKATALYSYDACQDDELSLSVGDIVHVIAQVILLTYFIFLWCLLCVGFFFSRSWDFGRLTQEMHMWAVNFAPTESILRFVTNLHGGCKIVVADVSDRKAAD